MDSLVIRMNQKQELINSLKTEKLENISKKYEGLKNPDTDTMTQLIIIALENNSIRSAAQFLNDHIVNLQSKQLILILKCIYSIGYDSAFEIVLNMCKEILLTNKISPNHSDGLPLVIAAKYGFTEIIDDMLSKKTLLFYTRNYNIDHKLMDIPYAPVYEAFDNCNYQTMKKIMKRIKKDVPSYDVKILCPIYSMNFSCKEKLDNYKVQLTRLQQEIDKEEKEVTQQPLTLTKEEENTKNSEFY
jgi:hypothetical protein